MTVSTCESPRPIPVGDAHTQLRVGRRCEVRQPKLADLDLAGQRIDLELAVADDRGAVGVDEREPETLEGGAGVGIGHRLQRADMRIFRRPMCDHADEIGRIERRFVLVRNVDLDHGVVRGQSVRTVLDRLHDDAKKLALARQTLVLDREVLRRLVVEARDIGDDAGAWSMAPSALKAMRRAPSVLAHVATATAFDMTRRRVVTHID